MHPARLILSTAAVAVPGPAARVGLPKKGLGAAGPHGPAVVVPVGAFVAPTAVADVSSAAAPGAGQADGGLTRGGDGDAATRLFGGQCRPWLALKGHGEKGRTMLEGQCVDAGGQWWRTSLNLNRCVGVHDGELVYQESGDFDSLCSPCVVRGGDDAPASDKGAAFRLECTCLDHLGRPKVTALQLGSQAYHPRAVRPSDGRLVCGTHEGDRTPLL